MASDSTVAAPLGKAELLGGRYRLERTLARGGAGEVFAARDVATGRCVALKRMLAASVSNRALNLGFMREYHLLAELRHPHIIEVYDYGVHEGVPYYTMELLDGRDLRELAPLPPRDACRYLRDVAASLALLHARRLLHRDTSPRNVRCVNGGRCKLLDFGTVVAFGVAPNIAGTPPLIPPEALHGNALDARSDLYSLGALAYFIVTNRHAYPSHTLDELEEALAIPVTRPAQLAEIPDALDELIMAMLARDPRQRPRSAAEVIERLSAMVDLPPDDLPDIARSFIVSSQLVGRRQAQAIVEQSLAHGMSGRGSTLMIVGDSGVGRTRLLAEAVHGAQLRGWNALSVVARGQRATETISTELMLALQRSAPEQLRSSTRFGGHEPDGWEAARAPTGEARARQQALLTALICDTARQRPLLIAVDDIERADDFSAALIASLSHEAPALPLMVIVTRNSQGTDSAFSALAMLRQNATILSLENLDRPQTASLLASVFGETPHLSQLCDWLYRVAHGNPALTLELTQHLFDRGVVRFLEGAWALPNEEIREPVPNGLTQTLALRLLRLTPVARDVAELMSVRRGGMSVVLACFASSAKEHEVMLAFDELTREGIVELAGEQYVFVQQAMREALRRSLTSEREVMLHTSVADALLASGNLTADAKLEAGWHLVHTPDALRGADLLAQIGPNLVSESLNIGSAIPAIEKALTIYEEAGRPLEARLRLRAQLVLSGYLFDYRLGYRYGSETLHLLHSALELGLATRLRRYIGGPLALLCTLAWVSVKRLFTSGSERVPSPVNALRYYASAALGLMGLRATALDGPGTKEILVQLDVIGSAAPLLRTLRVVHLSAKAFALQPLGREADLHEAAKHALQALQLRRVWRISESEHQELQTGLLLIDGLNECYRTHSQALERAERLDSLGTQLAAACAKRVRMIYYAVRGARDDAERERSALDLLAIQGGTTWQVEWFAAPVDGLAGAFYGDFVSTRRALDKLDALVSHAPTLEPLRDIARLGYHYVRGEFSEMAVLGESFIARHSPRSQVGWGPAYALTAAALAETGRVERALEICESGLAALSERDHEYFVMYAPLVGACARAHGLLGDARKAYGLLQALTSRLAAASEHAALAVAHDSRAYLARRLGHHDELRDAVVEMRKAALAADNAALVARAERWAVLHAGLVSHSFPPLGAQSATERSVRDGNTTEVTTTSAFLARKRGATLYRHTLQLLAEAARSSNAHLYEFNANQLQRVAALDDGYEPPAPVYERVRELLAAHSAPGQHVIELPANDNQVLAATDERRPRHYRLVVLTTGTQGAVAALLDSEVSLVKVSGVFLEEIASRFRA